MDFVDYEIREAEYLQRPMWLKVLESGLSILLLPFLILLFIAFVIFVLFFLGVKAVYSAVIK